MQLVGLACVSVDISDCLPGSYLLGQYNLKCDLRV
jgi:hypothetical protein